MISRSDIHKVKMSMQSNPDLIFLTLGILFQKWGRSPTKDSVWRHRRYIRSFFGRCAGRLPDLVIKGDDTNNVVLVSVSRCGFKVAENGR